MKSNGSFNPWFNELLRWGMIVKGRECKYAKNEASRRGFSDDLEKNV